MPFPWAAIASLVICLLAIALAAAIWRPWPFVP